MKTPSSTLFILIKCMTAAEQRHFKSQYSNNQITESKIILLFDIISAMENYDENLVKEKLEDISFSKNLKVHKNRLYQLLLNFLAQHSNNNTIAKQIRNNINIIDALLQKKMYKQADEMIHKTKSLCLEYEEYELLIYLQSIESRQLMYFREKDENIDKIIGSMRANLEIIDNYLSYAQWNYQLVQMRFRQDERLFNIPQLEEHIKSKFLLKNGEPIEPKSNIARRLREHCKSIIYTLKGEFRLAADCTRNIIIVMEQNPLLIKERPNIYFSALFNHMCSCAAAQFWEEFELYYDKQMALVEKKPVLEPYLIYTYTLLVEIYREKGEFKKAYNLYKNKVYSPSNNYSKYQDYPIDYFLAQILEVLLSLNKKEEIFDLLNTLQKDFTKLTPHIIPIVWIFQIVVYIQYKEWNLLSSWLEALRKRIQRNKIKNILLNQIISLAQKIITKPKEKHINLYKKHLIKITELAADKDKEVMSLKNIFNYEKWLKKQIL